MFADELLFGDVVRVDAEVSCFEGDEPPLVGDATFFKGVVVSLFGGDKSLFDVEASRFDPEVSLLADMSFFEGDVSIFGGLLFRGDLPLFSVDACEGRLGDLLCFLELSSDLLFEDLSCLVSKVSL